MKHFCVVVCQERVELERAHLSTTAALCKALREHRARQNQVPDKRCACCVARVSSDACTHTHAHTHIHTHTHTHTHTSSSSSSSSSSRHHLTTQVAALQVLLVDKIVSKTDLSAGVCMCMSMCMSMSLSMSMSMCTCVYIYMRVCVCVCVCVFVCVYVCVCVHCVCAYIYDRICTPGEYIYAHTYTREREAIGNGG